MLETSGMKTKLKLSTTVSINADGSPTQNDDACTTEQFSKRSRFYSNMIAICLQGNKIVSCSELVVIH